MLESIGLSKSLIFLIISYVKKLCQKMFIDFKTFKTLIAKFSDGYEFLNLVLFDIITYPKKFISVDEFIKLIKKFEIINKGDIGMLCSLT